MLTEKQLEEIRGWLEKAQNPLFFFHNDLDGLASYLLLKRYTKRGKGVAIKSYPGLNQSYARRIEELKPDVVFIVDSPTVDEGFFEEIRMHNLPVIWIDHHPMQKAEGINYYNPLEGHPSTHEPASYWCYKITKKDLWISFMGCISDAYIPEFKKEFKKEYPDLIEDKEQIEEIINKTEIGKLIQVLNFALKDKTSNVLKMLKALEETESPYQILAKEKRYESIWKRYAQLDKKFQSLFEKALEIAKSPDKLIFFKYGGQMKLSSELGNRLFGMFPEKIIIVAHEEGDVISMTLRGNKVRTYLENTLKKVEGRGGGHEKACGAVIRSENLPKFLEEMKKQL